MGNKKIQTMEEAFAVIDELQTRVYALEKKVFNKKNKKEKSGGAQVWETFSKYYQMRYKCEPVRNAATNRQCADLVNRVGLEIAVQLVEFYVRKCTDQFYVRNMHQVRYCLRDCEGLVTRMRTNTQMTSAKARQTEKAGASMSASQEYLQHKYGPRSPGK